MTPVALTAGASDGANRLARRASRRAIRFWDVTMSSGRLGAGRGDLGPDLVEDGPGGGHDGLASVSGDERPDGLVAEQRIEGRNAAKERVSRFVCHCGRAVGSPTS